MAGAGGTQDINYTPLLAVAVVEVQKWDMPLSLGRIMSLRHFHHKWGNTHLVPETADKRIVTLAVPLPTVHQQYEKFLKSPSQKAKTPESLKERAKWMLRHGLKKEFLKTMEELAALDKNDPVVVKFQKVQADMARPIATQPNIVDTLQKGLLDGYRAVTSDHYTLLHNVVSGEHGEVKHRLDRLEDNYSTFFYWFALKGVALPVPTERLVAVLVMRQDEFDRQHQIFDSVPLVADGFLARRENLAVFSLESVDAGSVALRKYNESTYWEQGHDREAALKRLPLKNVKDIFESAEIQTRASCRRPWRKTRRSPR